MKAEIKGDNLFITIPIDKDRTVSKSGKTLRIASSEGNKETDLQIDGKKVTIGLNAYIKKD